MEWARDYVREYFPDLTPEAAERFAAAIFRAFHSRRATTRAIEAGPDPILSRQIKDL